MEHFRCFLFFVVTLLAFCTDFNAADDYGSSTNSPPAEDERQSSLPPCRKCVWELTEEESEARMDALGNITEDDLLRMQEEYQRCPCTGLPDVSTERIEQMQQHLIEIKRQNPDLWPPNVTACCAPKKDDDDGNEPVEGCHRGDRGHRRYKRFSCTVYFELNFRSKTINCSRIFC